MSNEVIMLLAVIAVLIMLILAEAGVYRAKADIIEVEDNHSCSNPFTHEENCWGITQQKYIALKKAQLFRMAIRVGAVLAVGTLIYLAGGLENAWVLLVGSFGALLPFLSSLR